MEDIKSHISYNPDTGLFWWIKKGSMRKLDRPCGAKLLTGYVNITVNRKQYLAHRLAFLFMGESIPVCVDHINGVRDDNRWCNLRVATRQQNNRNRPHNFDTPSGYKGVHFHKPTMKWRARIGLDGVEMHLGLFDCKHEAADVYNKKAVELYGDFAWLNELPNSGGMPLQSLSEGGQHE